MHTPSLRRPPRPVCTNRAARRTRLDLDLTGSLRWGEAFIACLCLLGYTLI
jgi:hypothetical protein